MFGFAPRELPQRIGLILVPRFSMIAFTAAVEPLRLANRALSEPGLLEGAARLGNRA